MRNLLILLFLLCSLATARAESCVVIPRVSGSTDNIEFLIVPSAMAVNAISCYCQGDCVSPIATWQLHDRAGNNIPFDSTLTCATGTTDSTWVSISNANRNLTTGEGLQLDCNNNPASLDTVTVCVRFD